MIGEKEVIALASLARLKLSAEEKKTLIKDITSIVGYVDQLTEAKIEERSENKEYLSARVPRCHLLHSES